MSALNSGKTASSLLSFPTSTQSKNLNEGNQNCKLTWKDTAWYLKTKSVRFIGTKRQQKKRNKPYTNPHPITAFKRGTQNQSRWLFVFQKVLVELSRSRIPVSGTGTKNLLLHGYVTRKKLWILNPILETWPMSAAHCFCSRYPKANDQKPTGYFSVESHSW